MAACWNLQHILVTNVFILKFMSNNLGQRTELIERIINASVQAKIKNRFLMIIYLPRMQVSSALLVYVCLSVCLFGL